MLPPRGDFHPLYSFYKSKACDWLVTRRKEITSKKYKRKYLKWSRQKQRKIRTTHGVCEFSHTWGGCASFAHHLHTIRTPGTVVFRRPYLPRFSSKSYMVWSIGFLTSWALKWYIACKKWTSGSAPKVPKKTAAAVLYFPPCFSLVFFAFLLWMACLNDLKRCQKH